MKIGTKVKVVASKPEQEKQEEILALLGKEFSVTAHWKQEANREIFNNGEIQVYSEEFGGTIHLNKEEYIEL